MSKTAIITGASKGIGKAIAQALAKKHYQLFLLARNEKELHALKNELVEANPDIAAIEKQIHVYGIDLSIKKEIFQFYTFYKKTFPTPSVLVNNVGVYEENNITDALDILDDQLNINLKSAYYLSKCFIHDFISQKSGHIFNIGSILSKEIRENALDYTISKHAFYAFHKVLNQQLRPHGVKVTAFLPGAVNTSSWENEAVPVHEFIQPEDIAKLLIDCLNLSKYAVLDEIILRPFDLKF